jgi:muramoyltetrapeptide carboxypeptidase
MRIGVVAPSTPIDPAVAERVTALAAETHPEAEIFFHPQCFLAHGHFAGDDRARLEALVEMANDSGLDAIWFARGGYGSCRIAEAAIAEFGEAARDKTYLGYSDAGFLLAGLYKAGFRHLAHGPMPQDVKRDAGDEAIVRALDWLIHGSAATLEPSISGEAPLAAFNITVFSQLLGTALEPDLRGHVLMLEEVSEHTYRTDRAMFHITGNLAGAGIAGIRLGRCSLVPENDPDFGGNEEEVVRYWCERSGIPWLGLADIGHDAGNKVVPFGNVVQRSVKRA